MARLNKRQAEERAVRNEVRVGVARSARGEPVGVKRVRAPVGASCVSESGTGPDALSVMTVEVLSIMHASEIMAEELDACSGGDTHLY